jgi:hypothetical protein
MPMTSTCLPRRTVLLAVVLLVLVAGCTSGADAIVPDGFTAIERDEMAFALPADWQVRRDDPEDIEAIGTAQVDDSVEAITVELAEYTDVDLAAAARGVLTLLRASVDDADMGQPEPIDVAGADEAVRFESSYASQLTDGRIRQWDVFASVDGSTQLVYMSLKAPESVFDEARFTSILQTLQLRF